MNPKIFERLKKLHDYAGDLRPSIFRVDVYQAMDTILKNDAVKECVEIMLEDLTELPLMINKYPENKTAQTILDWRMRNRI